MEIIIPQPKHHSEKNQHNTDREFCDRTAPGSHAISPCRGMADPPYHQRYSSHWVDKQQPGYLSKPRLQWHHHPRLEQYQWKRTLSGRWELLWIFPVQNILIRMKNYQPFMTRVPSAR